jgi:hypothetical protein
MFVILLWCIETEQTETTEQTRIYGFPGPPFPLRGIKLVQYFYVETQGRGKRYGNGGGETGINIQEAGKAAETSRLQEKLERENLPNKVCQNPREGKK